MNMDKKVSILMGIYNCADTIDEAIESIIAQTYTNWQMIMCDDGSKDNTYEVAKKYVEQDPDRFVLIKNEMNQGLNKTLNNCLAIADGDYIARMDGDDVSLPTRFEKEVEFLNSHPEIAIVSAPMLMFDETGDWGRTKTPIPYPTKDDLIHHTPVFCHAPCMVRKEAYLDVKGYTVDERLLRVEDCHLWFKMYSKGYKGANLEEPLYKMRDDQNASARRTFKARQNSIHVMFVGYRLLKQPWYRYLRLVKITIVEFLKCIVPQFVYDYFHRRKTGKIEK